VGGRLVLLVEWTKLHVGVYGSLVGAMIAIVSFNVGDKPPLVAAENLPVAMDWFVRAIACWAVAGVSGGMIGTSLPDHDGSYDEFLATPLAPWPLSYFETFGLPARWWIRIEHVSFWIGAAMALLGSKYLILPG